MIPPRLIMHLPQDALERARALFIVEGSFAQIMGSLTTGAAFTGFALHLGAGPVHFGLLASLPAFAALIQLSAPYWTERLHGRRAVVVRILALSRSLWLVVALLPFLPLAAGLKVPALILIMTISGALAAISNTSWLSWIGDVVPAGMRGRYFATRNFVLGIIGLALGPLIGAFLDLLGRGTAQGPSVYAFVILFLTGMVAGWISLVILQRIIEPPVPQPREPVRLRRQLRLPWQDANVRGYMIFRATWSFSVGLAGNFVQVYLLSQLGLSYSLIYVLVTLGAVVNLLSLRFWGGLCDRVGSKPVLIISCLGRAGFALIFACTTATAYPLLVLAHCFSFFDGGLVLSTNNLLLAVSPRENNTAYLATHTAVVSVAAAISPLIGGLLVNSAQGLHLAVGAMALSNYQVLFLVSGVMRLLSVALMVLFHEKRAECRPLDVPATVTMG